MALVFVALPWASQPSPGVVAASTGAPREPSSLLPWGAMRHDRGTPLLPPATPPPSAQPTLPSVSVAGIATWYRWRPGEAAAGPALRAFLGPKWRGRRVTVCAGEACVTVTLSDWCLCRDRKGQSTLIDLDSRSFALLVPLSRGIVQVVVTP